MWQSFDKAGIFSRIREAIISGPQVNVEVISYFNVFEILRNKHLFSATRYDEIRVAGDSDLNWFLWQEQRPGQN